MLILNTVMPLIAASPKKKKKGKEINEKTMRPLLFFTDPIGRLIWLNTFIVDAYFKYISFKIM